MTFAICQKCGDSKTGALTLCFNCKFRASNECEVDIALILSDHYIRYYDLRDIGQKIRNGQFVQLEYYFVPLWKKLAWRMLNYFGMTSVASSLLANVKMKTLKERGKTKVVKMYS